MAVEPTPPPSLRYQDVVAAFIVDPNVCTDADPKEPFRILCTLRKTDAKYFANLWEYPGGKVETGETHAQALRRECAEELGIDIAVACSSAKSDGNADASADPEPCWSFSHAAQPDKDAPPGHQIVFRLFFYWATYDPAATATPPQPLAAQRLAMTSPKEMRQLAFCPGCREITDAFVSGRLRPPSWMLDRARKSSY